LEEGVDVNRGGGQLGVGFYVSSERSTAEWFAREWASGTDNPQLLRFSIPEGEFSKLKSVQLSGNSPEYAALTYAWLRGRSIPQQYEYLINDYDVILAPMTYGGGRRGTQVKFNPRAQSFISRYFPSLINLP
jgi:hypothetical protein